MRGGAKKLGGKGAHVSTKYTSLVPPKRLGPLKSRKTILFSPTGRYTSLPSELKRKRGRPKKEEEETTYRNTDKSIDFWLATN